MKALMHVCFVPIITILIAFVMKGNDKYYVNLNNQEIQQDDSLDFHWAMIGATKTKSKWNIFPIKKDTTLKSGDYIKFFFESKYETYVYLFLYDSEDLIHLLFPNFNHIGKPVKINEKYYIPPIGSSFQLDEKTGTETFYFIVSTKQLRNIENVVQSERIDSITMSDELKKKLLSEIRKVFQEYTQLYTSKADIPVSVAGTTRGLDIEKEISGIDIVKYSTQVKGRNLYAKKITINHR